MGLATLAAVGVNSIIGAGFYLLPAQYFATAGAWAPIVLLAMGVLMFAIALCFAEVGSRFRENGGAYLYVRSAFGPLVGFEIGWVLYLSRVISTASMFAALILLLEVTTGRQFDLAATTVVVIALTILVAAFSVMGGRTNAGLLTTLAVVKITPVVILIGLAIPHLDVAALRPSASLTWQAGVAAAAMGMFSYAGFENLAIPAGEARDPQRDVPRALVTSLAAGVVLLVGANAIAIGLVPDLASSTLALADAARAVLGPTGWWVMAATAMLAVVGSNAGALLANSRLLQSLSDQGDISAWFGRRSARFGTPVVAIALSSILVLALALTGTFQSLVVLAVGTRVLVYMGVALAAIRLRRADREGTAPPAGYRMPAAPLVLAIVMLGCGIILLQMTTPQAVAIALGLAAGLMLFVVRRAASGRTP
ncbi:APC family permease [Phenylobacterium sp.]|uniref:APC family permease n=1 Tax=Phenylobacterium sp. TaxID=1871053 RepID=UPI0025CC0AF3|nr:APC family permease [Phenylobacterium sp.]